MKILFFKASVRGYTRKDGTVVKPYSTKTPSAKGGTRAQGDLFGGGGAKLPPNRFKGVDPVAATPDLFSDTVTEPRKELIAEHKRLVAVLRSPSHKDDQAEAKRQEAELKEYQGGARQTLKASELTFGHIKSLIGNILNVHEWDVDNGGKVKAQVKTTTRNGTIHTAYMHITIVHPSGKWEYYRENSSGGFDLVSSGVEKQEVKARP